MAELSGFHFPIHSPISNSRVKLVPWDLDLHSNTFIAQQVDHPELFSHMPIGPFPTVADFEATLFNHASALSRLSFFDPAHFLFAVIDKTRGPSPEDEEGELAGTVAYLDASKVNLSTEIGMIVTLPKYQGTHVTTNAVGLALQHAFALGLRRMHWICSTANLASAKVAERMGYERVGVIPYHFRYPLGRLTGKVGNGKALPPGGDPDDVWRDTVVYSLSWDVWESEAREKVDKAMDR